MSLSLPIKVIIIDDEPLARSILLEHLKLHPELKLVAECGDGFEGAKAILEHTPDLIFLDIEMPKINGFEMLEILEHNPAIIFTTAYDQFAIQAFEKHAVDYLLKPIPYDRFKSAIEKVRLNPYQNADKISNLQQETPTHWDRIIIRNGKKIKIIPVNSIIHIAADDDYVQIHTSEGVFLKKETISNCEKHLENNNFVRIHRSHIININFIEKIELFEKNTYLAFLKDGTKIPISKNGYSKLREILAK